MKKVVIFGASGFIGSHLSRKLSREYEVINADQVSLDGLNVQQCDIMDISSLRAILDDKVDIVINLAGFSKLSDAIKDPLQVMNLNVIGYMNILEVCREKRIKNFVYSSSAYAGNTQGSFYSVSKNTSEKIIHEYYKHFGINYVILRIGSVYGRP